MNKPILSAKTNPRSRHRSGQSEIPRTIPKGRLDGVPGALAKQEVDQHRLCCGGLLEAETGSGPVVLRCLTCGGRWERGPDGLMTTAAPRDPSEEAQ